MTHAVRWFDSQPFLFEVTTLDKLFAVRTHVPLLPSSIIWYRSRVVSVACGWEGNRESRQRLDVNAERTETVRDPHTSDVRG